MNLPKLKVKHREEESDIFFDDPMNEGEKVVVATVYGGIEPYETEAFAKSIVRLFEAEFDIEVMQEICRVALEKTDIAQNDLDLSDEFLEGFKKRLG